MFDGKLGGTETWLAVRPWKATPEREASNRDPETALEEPGAAGPFNRRGRRRLFKRRNGSLLKLARSTRPDASRRPPIRYAPVIKMRRFA